MSIEDVWMITCWSDEMLEKKGITVDCNGPDGGAQKRNKMLFREGVPE